MATGIETREHRTRRNLAKLGLAMRKSRKDGTYFIYNPNNNALVYPSSLVCWATLEQIESETAELLKES